MASAQMLGSPPLPAKAAGPVEVLSANFDDETLGSLQQSGGPTLAYVAEGAGKALSVTGRANTWDSVGSAEGVLEHGVAYTLSARIKLVDADADAMGRFTMYDGSYTAVGAAALSTTAWTTVSGSYTLPAAVDAATVKFAVEAGSWAGSTPGFLLDDVLVTKAATGGGIVIDPSFVPGGAVSPVLAPSKLARGTGNVSALTFDDGPNGAYTTDLLDFLGANDVQATFCVIGQNIQATGGADILKRMVREGHTLCNHSTGYADMGSMTPEQAQADLMANLEIIRTALGNPNAQVPYFRAPNGSWGQTSAVAVALGMQPLAVDNLISDWETQDETLLTTRLRAAMKPGEIVLVHDGGGARAGSVAATKAVVAERLAAGWTFTLPVGGAPAPAAPSLQADFEDNTLQGWGPRDDGNGAPTVAVVADGHNSTYAARVSDRVSQGQGLSFDVSGLLTAGTTYELEAWIKFESDPGDMTFSSATTSGGTTTYSNLVQLTGLATGWTKVTGTFTLPQFTDSASVYFETKWANNAAGNTSTFLVDDITIRQPAPSVIEDLPALMDSVGVPLGVAIDSRETTGSASDLLLRHFNQITAENHMKPEAWYAADGTFSPHVEADALMKYSQDNDLRMYGHVLVWHSQTPDWFFQDSAGAPLPATPAGQQILKDRLRDHIFNVAEHLSDEYGEFGSATNPLVAWDVVNEVVSDGAENPDGLRRSEWFRILGEQYIDLAFQYADEAFNDEFASASGPARPVALFINDYNTEQSGKQQRYFDLVERLLERGVPLDGVGHQFHVNLDMPVSALESAITRFEGMGVTQAVTEFDVTTGTPVTQARLIDQGYYFRDAFEMFRAHESSLFSITVWGLTDGRSWRDSSGAPLVFNDALLAKPAYYGAAGASLPARLRTADVFGGDVAITPEATSSPEWDRLRLRAVDDNSAFQLRWAPDHLTAYVKVADGVVDAADKVTLVVGDDTHTFHRDGSGDVDGVATEVDGGWVAVVHLPLNGAVEGSTLQFDVRVAYGSSTGAWNTPGAMGTLTLLEPISYLEVAQASTAPAIDGAVDDVWADSGVIATDKQVQGTGGAIAQVRTLWKGDTLYVLADVTDPIVDVTGSDPWIQDSVELFVDAGNHKNGGYRAEDTQIRISADNVVSFGTGDESAQRARLESAVVRTATGYRVEAAVDLLGEGGLATFHGLDFQVNDASAGARTGITNWADPTGAGYQSTARWGVGQLVEAVDPPVGPQEPVPSMSLSDVTVAPGGAFEVRLAGFTPGDEVTIQLIDGTAEDSGAQRRAARVRVAPGLTIGTAVVGADGTAVVAAQVPADTPFGVYRIGAAVNGVILVEASLTVAAADAGTPGTPGTPGAPGTTPGATTPGGWLASTGMGLGLGLLAVVLVMAGLVFVVVSRRRDALQVSDSSGS
ncbi:endo-1,4-beta-xylanase [Cellulomonas cellasea]|uniref:endo-1,4-beta-xylanase n=1 Tax=Cellulomonas cellasea TaxID=43670 RepID=UPI0025A3E3A3|nr:endo-1,4-beta-xylanase [Cellulomonas cellasea]MDM8084450.1 endo-1,4-beta-xylanase [Cellulomonas cellasea]